MFPFQVGTPMYAAPEVLRGDGQYNEKADVYSFGMLLINVAVDTGGLGKFVEAKWAADHGERRRIIQVLTEMINGEWHPIANDEGQCLKGAPPSLRSLASRCCSYRASDRPSFQDILEMLAGSVVTLEIAESASPFSRMSPEELLQASPDESSPREQVSSNNPIRPNHNMIASTETQGESTEVKKKALEQKKTAHRAHASSFTLGPHIRNMVSSASARSEGAAQNEGEEPKLGEFRIKVQGESFTDM
jgi:serine/threonine protein kinase